MYKFTADLELRHIRHEDRIAEFRGKKVGDYYAPAVVLIYMEGKGNYVVASFNEHLHCNNAQSFQIFGLPIVFEFHAIHLKRKGDLAFFEVDIFDGQLFGIVRFLSEKC